MSIRLDSEKKTVLVLMVLTLGMLLVAGSVYADGDLIVNGKLGVGTDSPSSKVQIVAGDGDGLSVSVAQATDLAVSAGSYGVNIVGSERVYVTSGFTTTVRHSGSQTILPAIRGGGLNYYFWSDDDSTSSDFNFIWGLDMTIRARDGNKRDYSGNTIAGFKIGGDYVGTGTITVTDYAGALIKDITGNPAALNATNVYGMKIDQQTAGINNYGIALVGDGDGADIVFGPNQKARIYSLSEELWVEDGAGNKTQISPHDPETGEWVYYSKNVKTGEVVRVDMEALVKTVEELSGKTFMVRTIEEVK